MKRILCGFCGLFFASSLFAAGLSLSGSLTAIRVLTNDQVTTGVDPHYSDAVLTAFLNLEQYAVCDITWCLTDRSTATLAANTTYYALSSDVYTPYRVMFGTSVLKVISYPELDKEYGGWTTAQTANGAADFPTRYYMAVGTFTQIGLYPPPNVSKILTVDSVLMPTELSSSTDMPFNGIKKLYPYHYVLALRVAAQINTVRGQGDAAAFEMTQANLLLLEMANTVKIKAGEIPKPDPKAP